MTDSSEIEIPKETKPPKSARISRAKWAEAVALWESGSFTLSQISKKVGVTKEHLSRRFKKEGFEKGAKAKEASDKAKDAVESEVEKQARLLPMRIRETKEEHYVWSRTLSKAAMQEVAKALHAGRPLSSIGEDLKSIDRAATILNKCLDARSRVTGMESDDFVDDETLPSLLVELLTEEEMENIRSSASQKLGGVDDGLGGVILDEDDLEDDIVEMDFEDLDEDDLDAVETIEESGDGS